MLSKAFFLLTLLLPSVFSFAPGLPHGVNQNLSGVLFATWSDSKAVKDYQDFLASGKQEIELAQDRPSVIVKSTTGSSDLADALSAMGMGDDIVVTPDQDLPASADEYPIYVALAPWEIEDFLKNLRDSYRARPEDFVFFSGGLNHGNIEGVLQDRGYCRDSMTQVLISGMQLTEYGRVQDLSVRLDTDSANGEEKWAGECATCGKWAGAVAQRLERNEIRCRTDFYREWRRRMWERTVFDAVFHLMGVVRSQPTTVAQVANYYSQDVSDQVWEMSQLLRGWKALTLTYGFEERMFAFAEKNGAEQPTTLINEMYPYIWGNHVFLESKMFVEYLNYAQQEMGFLQGVSLPQKSDDQFASKMRQGNLRADGVV